MPTASRFGFRWGHALVSASNTVVIAETRDLGVRYIKSVVTDDQGRYVVPDLPAASYAVWDDRKH